MKILQSVTFIFSIVFLVFVFIDDAKLRGLAAPNNLSMNQNLEGHSGKSYSFHIIFCL